MIKNIKKFFMFVFAFVIGLGSLVGLTACDKNNSNNKLSVVCTIFPEYDWVQEVVGNEKDNFELTLLMNNGTDLHSYEPTVADVAKIATADIFIYVGGESDEWVDDALKNATNKDMVVINLLEVLGDNAKEEKLKEGMQDEEHDHEHDEEHKHEEDENDEHEHEEVEYDEHVWLSFKNAQTFVSEIADALSQIDGSNANKYQANAKNYNNKLNALDGWYKKEVEAQRQVLKEVSPDAELTILFGDRFPFRYLVEDYGIDYFAAFIGCSAETEASFETVTFLSNKIDELELNVVLIIENSSDKIAKTVIENTTAKNQTILVLDSMQSTTLADNKSYFSIMVDNLVVLMQAIQYK